MFLKIVNDEFLYNEKNFIGIENAPKKKDWKWKCLSVDASRAGGGILEVAILADKNHVPHTLEDLGKGIYEVSFVGEEAVRHRVHLTFNEIYIPGIFSHFLRSMFKWFF